MSTSEIEVRRFPRLGRKVALYVGLAFLGAVALIGAVAWRQGLLQAQQPAYLQARDATGIALGMPVKFLGFGIGSVSEMRMKRSTVEIELTLNAEYAAFVPHGSHAKLSREGLIGAAFIEIVPNPEASGRSLASGEVLRYERALAPAEMADDLKRRAEPVLTGFRQTVDWLNAPEGEFRQSLTTTRELIGAVSKSHEQVGIFMQRANAAAGSVRDSAATVSVTIDRLAHTSARVIEDELPRIGASTSATMQDVAAAAKELHRTTRMVNERLEKTSRKVDDAVSDARGVAADAGELTQAVRRTWPFSRTLVAPRTRALPMDINDAPLPWPERLAPPPADLAPGKTE